MKAKIEGLLICILGASFIIGTGYLIFLCYLSSWSGIAILYNENCHPPHPMTSDKVYGVDLRDFEVQQCSYGKDKDVY